MDERRSFRAVESLTSISVDSHSVIIKGFFLRASRSLEWVYIEASSQCLFARSVHLSLNDKRKHSNVRCEEKTGEHYREHLLSFSLFVRSFFFRSVYTYFRTSSRLKNDPTSDGASRAIKSFETHIKYTLSSILTKSEFIRYSNDFTRRRCTRGSIDRGMISKASSLTILHFVRTVNIT